MLSSNSTDWGNLSAIRWVLGQKEQEIDRPDEQNLTFVELTFVELVQRAESAEALLARYREQFGDLT
ncbi:MAG TPA: hypothetical protein V6C57_09205 [Coleofasciculaceae cyanobacterium]